MPLSLLKTLNEGLSTPEVQHHLVYSSAKVYDSIMNKSSEWSHDHPDPLGTTLASLTASRERTPGGQNHCQAQRGASLPEMRTPTKLPPESRHLQRRWVSHWGWLWWTMATQAVLRATRLSTIQ